MLFPRTACYADQLVDLSERHPVSRGQMTLYSTYKWFTNFTGISRAANIIIVT